MKVFIIFLHIFRVVHIISCICIDGSRLEMFWGKFCCLPTHRCQRRQRGDKRRKRHLFTCNLANRFSSPPFHLSLLLLLFLLVLLLLLILALVLLLLVNLMLCFVAPHNHPLLLLFCWSGNHCFAFSHHLGFASVLLLSDSPVFSETAKTLWAIVQLGAKELCWGKIWSLSVAF